MDSKTILVLATANRGKIEEIKALLTGLPVEVQTVKDYPGLDMPAEDRDTFAGNARKKAEAVSAFTGQMALADDSGLEVEALGGRPGVYSARYAGEGAGDRANNELLLEEMKKMPRSQRKARFRCALALAVPGDETRIIEATCPGTIAFAPQGEGGFGYDPLFIHEPTGISFARMSRTEKNRVSHRGKALQKTRLLLEKLL